MANFITLNAAIKRAKKIKPNWIAVDKDGHIRGHVDKPKLGIVTESWISPHHSWDLGFFRKREEWENTLRRIHYD